MQVSWIEADDLKDLLARIAPEEPAAATPPPPPRSWDHMPAVDPATAASFIITAEEPFVTAEPQEIPPLQPEPSVPAAREAEASPEAPPPEQAPSPEAAVTEEHADHSAAALPLNRIRDKLRAIRQRAHEAGMLTKGGEAAAPAPQVPPVKTTPATPGGRRDALHHDGEQASEVKTTSATPGGRRDALHHDGEQASEVKTAPALRPAASSAPGLPKFEAPAGDRQERLGAFASWARQILHEDGGHLLVMNDDGELLWGGEAKAGLVLSAMMAWGATLRGSASAACGSLPVLHQDLASGHALTAIPCETLTGVLLHAAVVGPARVPDEIAMQLRQGLIRAAGTQFD